MTKEQQKQLEEDLFNNAVKNLKHFRAFKNFIPENDDKQADDGIPAVYCKKDIDSWYKETMFLVDYALNLEKDYKVFNNELNSKTITDAKLNKTKIELELSESFCRTLMEQYNLKRRTINKIRHRLKSLDIELTKYDNHVNYLFMLNDKGVIVDKIGNIDLSKHRNISIPIYKCYAYSIDAWVDEYQGPEKVEIVFNYILLLCKMISIIIAYPNDRQFYPKIRKLLKMK